MCKREKILLEQGMLFGAEDALSYNLPFCKKVTRLKNLFLASADTSANRVMGVP